MVVSMKMTTLLTLALFLATSNTAGAATFTDRAAFLSHLGSSVTDDYESGGYVFGDLVDFFSYDRHSDSHMSSVLGETRYYTTSIPDNNIIYETDIFGYNEARHVYCGGCNGAFLLNFESTSVGTAKGVFGVGFDFMNRELNSEDPYFTAFVTYGNGATENILLPFSYTFDNPAFFGLTSHLSISSIAFGLPIGERVDGVFGIDNLTIGSPVASVPIPAALPLLASGLGALGFVGWRRKHKAAQASGSLSQSFAIL